MKNNYTFFNNSQCEYFPCHKTSNPENFNCLFCFCPLYALKDKCGGKFKYTEDGVKDCSDCIIPHTKNSHGYIMSKIGDILELGKK